VLVPPTRVGLPNRDAETNASPRSGCPPACGVRIDVHGSKDRVKDASPGACDDHSCVRRVHTLRAHARPRSPPRRPPDIRCRRRTRLAGGTREKREDRPRSSFRRRPAKSDAFPKAGMPFTVATREILKETIPQASRRLSHSRRPHRPGAPNACVGWALRGHGAVTRGSVNVGSTNAFSTRMKRAWN